MCWNSRRNASTLASLMRRWTLSTGLLALALAAPRLARGQAEEAPEPVADIAPAPASLPSTAPPVPASPAPAVAPTARTPPPVAVGRDHGLVLVPYFGFNLPVGSLAEVYSAGFRFGALVGWHVTPRMSMNGELTLDFMDADTDSSFVKPHERYLDFALSPLLHFRSGEIVVGPKLGWFTNNRSDSDDDRVVYLTYGTRLGLGPHSGQGLLLGINAGGFISVGKLAIGLVASGTFRHFITVDCSGYGCGGQFSNATALSLSLAALF